MRLFTTSVILLLLAVPPHVGQAQPPLDVEVGSYSTYFKSSGVTRARNVRLTAEKIDGTIIMPGEIFSYNDTVGERTKEAGFKPAHALRGGRVVTEYGGGVCQLASTLHAAALYAGLTMVEHHRHSRVSSYIRPGFDATVSWGEKDLKIMNSGYSYPIRIEVTEPKPGKLTVKLYSSEVWYDIGIKIVIKKTIPFETQVILVEDRNGNSEKQIAAGTLGYHIWRIRHFRLAHNGFLAYVERNFAYYPPSPRIIERGTLVQSNDQ